MAIVSAKLFSFDIYIYIYIYIYIKGEAFLYKFFSGRNRMAKSALVLFLHSTVQLAGKSLSRGNDKQLSMFLLKTVTKTHYSTLLNVLANQQKVQ